MYIYIYIYMYMLKIYILIYTLNQSISPLLSLVTHKLLAMYPWLLNEIMIPCHMVLCTMVRILFHSLQMCSPYKGFLKWRYPRPSFFNRMVHRIAPVLNFGNPRLENRPVHSANPEGVAVFTSFSSRYLCICGRGWRALKRTVSHVELNRLQLV